MVAVSPTTKHPTHHISLTDGVTTIGLKLCDGRGHIVETISKSGFPRTAMQMSTGATGGGDYVPPFTPIPQTTWIGGRAAEDLDSDSSRYSDSESIDTTHGDILLAGKPTISTGSTTSIIINNLVSATNIGNAASTFTDASPYTPAGNTTMRQASVYMRATTGGITTFPVTCRMLLYSDSANAPNAVLATSSYRTFTALPAAWYAFDLAYNLTAGTKYWLALEAGVGSFVTLGMRTDSGGPLMYKIAAGWIQAWATYGLSLAIVTGSGASGTAHFFQYRGQLYAATAPDDGSAPKLYMNGYRGVAASNTSDLSKVNTALNLTGVNLAGCVVKIVKGPGSTEYQNWRVITSNTVTGTNDSITVNPRWNIDHTNATEFVILGCDTWQDVATMTGGAAYAAVLKYPVTGVAVSEDQVHIAQGLDAADAYLVDFNQDNNSGTFRTRIAKNAADVPVRFIRTTTLADGTKNVYLTTSNYEVKAAPAVAYGNALVPGTAIPIGRETERITGLRAYGDPSKMYVFKEDQYGAISDEGAYARIPLDEYAACASDRNGVASCVNGVYLFFSFLDGLERYYDQQLDDVGPNRDEGFPAGRRGNISHLLSYPGRIFAAVDAGDSGQSCVVCYNGQGWHELYRAAVGARIRNLEVQVMPHLGYNKLWMSVDENLIWIPVAINPRQTTGYPYALTGNLTSAWMYSNLKDVTKFYDYLTLHTENLLAGHRTITLEYRTDTETTWHTAAATATTSPTQSLDLTTANDTDGVRLQYRITMTTDDPLISPRVKAAVLNAVVRLPVKHMYSITFLAEDYSRDLNGVTIDTADAKTLQDKLDEWADSSRYAKPLYVRSNINEVDDFWAFIEPSADRLKQVDADGKAVWIGQATLIGM